MTGELMTVAQFGFAALAAWMMWTLIRDLLPRLLEIISQNSEALTKSASAMEQVARGQENIQTRLGRMDDRLLVLEEQHKRVGECPFERTRKELRDGSADYHVGAGGDDHR